MKFSMLSQALGMSKLLLNLFCTSNVIMFEGENCADMNFMKYIFNIIMCRDTCEPITGER